MFSEREKKEQSKMEIDEVRFFMEKEVGRENWIWAFEMIEDCVLDWCLTNVMLLLSLEDEWRRFASREGVKL